MLHRALLALLVTLQSPFAVAQAPEKLREPFLRLRIDDRQALADNRQLAALWRSMRQVIDEEGEGTTKAADRLAALWNELPTPLELFVIAEDSERLVFGLTMPPATKNLGDALRELGVVGPPPLVIAGEDGTTLSVDRDRALAEGEAGGRHVVIFDTSGVAPELDAFLAATERSSPGTRRLQRTLTGKGTEVLVNTEQLLAAAPDEMRGSFAGLKMLLGARFAGFTLRLEGTAERLVTEFCTDLVPGQGVLGSLLPKDPSAQRLTGWLPADAEEFFNVRVAIEGVAAVLQLAATFGGLPLDPAAWGEEFAGLAGTDVPALLAEHFTGEVQILSVPTKAEEVLDAEAQVPMVMMFGTPDGAKGLAALRDVLGKLGEFTLTPEPEFGKHVHELSIADESWCRIVAHPTFLAFAGVDETSTALLRAALATGGTAPLPARYRERLGDAADPLPMMLGVQHLFSGLQGQTMMRELAGRPSRAERVLPRLVEVFAADFGGELGLAGLRVDAGNDGLRVRQVW